MDQPPELMDLPPRPIRSPLWALLDVWIGLAGVLLLFAGLAAALIGPSWLRLGGAFGFVLIFVICIVVRFRALLGEPTVAAEFPSALSFRTALQAGIGAFVLLAAAGAFAFAASGPGLGSVHDKSKPLLAERAKYELSNHGEMTVVSRSVFIANGVGFMAAWTFGSCAFAVAFLHFRLYGNWPLGSEGSFDLGASSG